MGQHQEADELKKTWKTIAREFEIVEDDYGFYDPQFLLAIRQTIDDMVTEAAPLAYTEREVSATQAVLPNSPVNLLNEA